jgi:hypothetical protein
MSTSLATSSEGSYRSSQRSKNGTTPPSDHNQTPSYANSPTKHSNAPKVPSPRSGENRVISATQSPAPQKKSPRSKKSNNNSQHNRNTTQSRQSSQADALPSDKKATPLKQAYAGPTFHSSPAASSLPMPSFYSKSLPAVTASPALAPSAQLDGHDKAESDTYHLQPDQTEDLSSKGREPSPLDFMFEAARKARGSPQGQSPETRLGRLSPFEDGPRQIIRTPGESSSDSVFPFELDGNGGRSMSVGPAFATPYKERMAEALRSRQGLNNPSPQNLNERQRKEKSDALKRLLASGSPQRSPNKSDANGYFPDRTIVPLSSDPHDAHTRNRSSSSTPKDHFRNVSDTTQGRDAFCQRPVSSHLRREFQPDGYQLPVELESDSALSPRATPGGRSGHRPSSTQTYHQPLGQPSHPTLNSTMQTRSFSSAQKLEDDLRRALKLDVASNS